MPKNSVLSIGSCLRDFFCYTKGGYVIETKKLLVAEVLGFEVGGKTAAESVLHMSGGSAANTAVTFARLGFPAAILTSVGADDLGTRTLADLKKRGVKVASLPRIAAQPTGVSFIINQLGSHKHTIIAYRGAAEDLKVSAAELVKSNARVVYLSALHGKHAAKNMQAVAVFVKQKKVDLFWNPGGWELSQRYFIARYAPLAAMLVLNRDEANELIKPRGKGKAPSLSAVTRSLHGFGSRIAVVTDGHRGASAYDGKKLYYQPAIIGKTVNKTGAGDAFGSAFAAGLFLFNGNIPRAMKLAAQNAHAVVGAIGAQTGVLSYKDIRRLKI